MLHKENSPDSTTRRAFLQTAAVGALTAALGDMTAPAAFAADEERITTLNGFLSQFPEAEHIPGIEKVEIITHEGATRVLCLFEQVHWVDNIQPESLAFAEACQLDLYNAYRSLKDNRATNLDTIYVEGVYHGSEDEILDIKRADLKERLETIATPDNAAAMFTMSLETKRPDTRALSTLRQTVDGSSTLVKIGAAELLGFHGELRILGAENKAHYLKTFELEDQMRWDELDEYLYDKREDALLKYASQANKTIAYTVYGANHNFRDNVIAHNSISDEKFSLVILTPPAVTRFRAYEKRLEEEAEKKRAVIPPAPAQEFIPF